MQLIWIILRSLFPRDPLRQGAEVLRQRVAQLAHVAQDPATLRQLFFDPALRLQLELLILDVEDCLRLWIAMRGCQIAKVRPKSPRRRCTPHLTHARDLRDLITRIHALAAMFARREKLARAHAAKLKHLRDANPLGLATHGSTGAAPCAAAHHEAVDAAAGLMVSSTRSVRPSNHEAVLTALTSSLTRGSPHSIAGATP
jgi:hypothetical protein